VNAHQRPAAPLPPGIENAYTFFFFNSVCFQIVLGAPMVIFANNLGASATVVGILTSMTPLFAMLQMPAVNYVSRVGYKAFVMAGWGSRTFLILVPCVLPWCSGIWPSSTRLVIFVVTLAAFTIIRGISSCAWMPWITSLLPPERRAHYMIREQSVVMAASLFIYWLSGLILGATPSPARFTAVFFISFASGIVSLWFLTRIPDTPAEELARTSSEPVPWGAICRHPPFQAVLVASAIWVCGVAGLSSYTIVFLKTAGLVADGEVIQLAALFYAGGFLGLWTLVPAVERVGSKPVCIATASLVALAISGWLSLAMGWIEPDRWWIGGLYGLTGLGSTVFTVSSTRWLMAVTPEFGRVHFFALHTAVTSALLGGVPVAWGIVIDAMGSRWNSPMGSPASFPIFFGVSLLFLLLLLPWIQRMHEPEAKSLDELLGEIFYHAPARTLSRLFGNQQGH